jgi:hypothetical protein
MPGRRAGRGQPGQVGKPGEEATAGKPGEGGKGGEGGRGGAGGAGGEPDATLAFRVVRLEDDLKEQRAETEKLSDKIDRLLLAFVVGLISLSASLVVAALVYMGSR